MSNQDSQDELEASNEALHIIRSAYQDIQGVMAGKKGYRLRQNELALHIDQLVQKAVTETLDWARNEVESDIPVNVYDKITDRIATLTNQREEK